MQLSFSVAVALAKGEQVVFVMRESKVLWKAGVSGRVRGKAPPLWRMAARKRWSSRPP